MAVISVRCKGNFTKTTGLLQRLAALRLRSKLVRYGQMGVDALRSATPMDSGKTADSWGYRIEDDALYWVNTNINKNVNIAIIIQYGHGTGTGGYVEGIDYINPAIRPIFEQIANELWKEVVG